MTIKVIGIGNRFRRDDGAAVVALRHLKPRTGVDMISTSAEPTNLMTAWEGAEAAILIDAAAPAGAPGRISRIVAGRDSLPTESPVASTHAYGLAKTIDLAEALGDRPDNIIIYAIEGANFDHGEGLSLPVENAISILVQKIEAEIEKLTKKVKSHA